ncbi:MAG: lipoprotein signal peptidase [Prevotellaceae bacterium]|nr:lipoprotein signal peptidase [Prevotellaceae bacterium]
MSVKVKSILLILFVLIVDQASKIYIKLNFSLGESVDVCSWFQIYFIENNGMAFGMEIFGKLFLTLFRIVAVGAFVFYICHLIKKGVRAGYILTISLMLAGAAGNIFDSVFYGVLFSESSFYRTAVFLPEEGGYAPIFYGKVVDMLYFPIIKNAAGETLFFSPIFNIADSAITVSIFLVLLFFRKELNESLESKKDRKRREEKQAENEPQT